MTAAMSTDTIVTAFELTDELIAQKLPTADYLAVCDTRGWMIDELERRGAEFRIGL
jgi:hypothetical protein